MVKIIGSILLFALYWMATCSFAVADSALIPDPDARPPLFLHKDNYLLGGLDTLDRSSSVVFKYQISGKFRVLLSQLYLAYTQRSFMAVNKDSFPFYDHNFEPEIFYNFIEPTYDWFEGFQIGVSHQSNGKDGEDSKSWNRIYLKGFFQKGLFYFRPSFWFPFASDPGLNNQKSMSEYLGIVSLESGYRWRNRTELSVLGRIGYEFNKGGVQVDFSMPTGWFKKILGDNEHSRVWTQLWCGYGESLIGFDQLSIAGAIGVGFRP
ncbi:MAG: phospholipase A [Bdellovibrionales bacterium]|nr:phospholipase A [Bdellovibrionales bacterium]